MIKNSVIKIIYLFINYYYRNYYRLKIIYFRKTLNMKQRCLARTSKQNRFIERQNITIKSV